MKQALQIALGVLLTTTFLPMAAHAKPEKQAIYSPKCDANKLKQIGAGAVVSVNDTNSKGGKVVELDTSKMSWKDFTQKMSKEGCF